MSSISIRKPETLREDLANLRLLFSIQQHIINDIIPNLTQLQIQKLSWEEIIDIPIVDPETTMNLEICEDAYGGLAALYMSLSQLAEDLRFDIDINRNENYDETDISNREAKYILTINAYTQEHSKDNDDDITHSETYILPNVATIAGPDTPKPPAHQKKNAEYN